MSKTFEYFHKTGEIRRSGYEWDGDEGEFFKYEVSDEELLPEVAWLIYEEYFKHTELADRCDYSETVRKGIEKFISDFDLLDDLADTYENELKDVFEEEALENYD